MPKFSTDVPSDLLDVIKLIRVNHGVKKGVAIEYVLHLARLKPDIAVKDYTSDKKGPCNLGLKDGQMPIFRQFRANHRPILDRDGQFFEAALKIGASAYEAGYHLNETKDFEKAILIEPVLILPKPVEPPKELTTDAPAAKPAAPEADRSEDQKDGSEPSA